MTRSISQVGMLTVVSCLLVGLSLTAGEREKASKADLDAGREIFVREWLPGDSRSKGGDGLGPVFNDSSCVACHNQGGIGGGGPNSKNVEIVTPFAQQEVEQAQPSLLGAIVRIVGGGGQSKPKKPTKAAIDKERLEKIRKQREELAKHHPGFKSARSVVLHHFGVDPKFASWRSQLTGQHFQLCVDIQAVTGLDLNGCDTFVEKLSESTTRPLG